MQWASSTSFLNQHTEHQYAFNTVLWTPLWYPVDWHATSIHLVLIWMSAHVCHFQVFLLLGSTHFFRSCSLLQAIQVLMSWPSWQGKTLQKCWPLWPFWIGSRHWRNWLWVPRGVCVVDSWQWGKWWKTFSSMSILHLWLISPETLFMTFAKDNL
jgi:hypothetical protein